MSALLAADYEVRAIEKLRSVILNRQAQQIAMANQAVDDREDDKFFAAMATVAVYDVVLQDIRAAIQREQAR